MKKENLIYSGPLFLFSLLVMVIAMLYSMYSWRWHWFARSGALMDVVGIIMTGQQFIESGRRYQRSRGWVKDSEELVDEGFERYYQEVNLFTDYLGFWLLIVGTIIWGFGDLPGLLPPPKH